MCACVHIKTQRQVTLWGNNVPSFQKPHVAKQKSPGPGVGYLFLAIAQVCLKRVPPHQTMQAITTVPGHP